MLYIYLSSSPILTSIYFTVMKTELAKDASLGAISGFNKDELKKAETVEKNTLPNPEGKFLVVLNT